MEHEEKIYLYQHMGYTNIFTTYIFEYEIMEKVLFEKVKKNPYVKEKLLETKDFEIIEDCGEDDDKDWGCGIDGTGQNNLGKIWMKIREKLRL